MGQVLILPVKANATRIQDEFVKAMYPVMQSDILDIVALPENRKRDAVHDVVRNIMSSFSRNHPFLGAMQCDAKEILFEALADAEESHFYGFDHGHIRQEWEKSLINLKNKLTDWATRKPITEPLLPKNKLV